MHYCLFDFACIVTWTLCHFSRFFQGSRDWVRFFPVSLLRKNREIKNPNQHRSGRTYHHVTGWSKYRTRKSTGL